MIIETQTNPNNLKKSCQMLGFDGFLCSCNKGYEGDIIMVWKASMVDIQ